MIVDFKGIVCFVEEPNSNPVCYRAVVPDGRGAANPCGRGNIDSHQAILSATRVIDPDGWKGDSFDLGGTWIFLIREQAEITLGDISSGSGPDPQNWDKDIWHLQQKHPEIEIERSDYWSNGRAIAEVLIKDGQMSEHKTKKGAIWTRVEKTMTGDVSVDAGENGRIVVAGDAHLGLLNVSSGLRQQGGPSHFLLHYALTKPGKRPNPPCKTPPVRPEPPSLSNLPVETLMRIFSIHEDCSNSAYP